MENLFNIMGANEMWHKISTILIYSLGLGLLLAIVTGIVLLCTIKSTPLVRYRILVCLLCGFGLGVAAIAFLQFGTDSTLVQSVPNSFNAENALLSTGDSLLSLINQQLFVNHSKTIVLVWLLIMLAKGIQLTTNIFNLRYLKTNQIYPVGSYWEDRLQQLAQQIGLNRAVTIVQSGLIQVPMVIGHLKPVILVPLGMITAIKPEQLEMILLHELSHIKRIDFLVNMLQHVLELFFFFNPALLWLSALIRRERENCCDEMVIANNPSKQVYIRALLSFGEYQLKPAYAMAFAQKNNLVGRVQRIASQKNSSLNAVEKGLLLLTVLILCTVGMLNANKKINVKQDIPKNQASTKEQAHIESQVAYKKALIAKNAANVARNKSLANQALVKKTQALAETQSKLAQKKQEMDELQLKEDEQRLAADQIQQEKDQKLLAENKIQHEQDQKQLALDQVQLEKDRLQTIADIKSGKKMKN